MTAVVVREPITPSIVLPDRAAVRAALTPATGLIAAAAGLSAFEPTFAHRLGVLPCILALAVAGMVVALSTVLSTLPQAVVITAGYRRAVRVPGCASTS